MNPHQRCLQAKVKYRSEPKTGNANGDGGEGWIREKMIKPAKIHPGNLYDENKQNI